MECMPLPRPSQGSADDDGNRGNDEPEADDAQRLLSGQNGCRLVGEEAGQRTGEAQADDHAQPHDDGRQRQSGAEDLADTGIFFSAIVVADDGADTLYDAVGRQIDKGLQFIVDAQDENVHRREYGQYSVEAGDEQRRQCHVQRRRNTYQIDPLAEITIKDVSAEAEPQRQRPDKVDDEIDDQGQGLSDDGGPGCAADTHDRERTEAEDHDRVQNDVGDGTAEHADHRDRHFAFRLKDFFKGDRRRDDGGEGKDDIGIVQTILQNVLILGKKTQENRRAKDADRGQQDAVNQAAGHAAEAASLAFSPSCAPRK